MRGFLSLFLFSLLSSLFFSLLRDKYKKETNTKRREGEKGGGPGGLYFACAIQAHDMPYEWSNLLVAEEEGEGEGRRRKNIDNKQEEKIKIF